MTRPPPHSTRSTPLVPYPTRFRAGPAIGRLVGVSGDGSRSTVSGVGVRDDGLILTRALPLRGATTITAVLSDGRQLDASVRGLDDATDVAVVDVDADQLEVAVLGSSADLAVGDVVVALGYPLGLRGSRSEERRVGKECVRTCRSRWSLFI